MAEERRRITEPRREVDVDGASTSSTSSLSSDCSASEFLLPGRRPPRRDLLTMLSMGLEMLRRMKARAKDSVEKLRLSVSSVKSSSLGVMAVGSRPVHVVLLVNIKVDRFDGDNIFDVLLFFGNVLRIRLTSLADDSAFDGLLLFLKGGGSGGGAACVCGSVGLALGARHGEGFR